MLGEFVQFWRTVDRTLPCIAADDALGLAHVAAARELAGPAVGNGRKPHQSA
jgi:hypothetical protein